MKNMTVVYEKSIARVVTEILFDSYILGVNSHFLSFA